MADPVICPYCHQKARLRDSAVIYGKSYGYQWFCHNCLDVYVGCHKGGNGKLPLGTMANKELRNWRMNTHILFDSLWKSNRMSRHEAYEILREVTDTTSLNGHIAMFDIDQCKKLITYLENNYD
jgi:hypothetical protein